MKFNTVGEKWVDTRVIDGIPHAVYRNEDGVLYVYADPVILNEGYCPECDMPEYRQRVRVLSA